MNDPVLIDCSAKAITGCFDSLAELIGEIPASGLCAATLQKLPADNALRVIVREQGVASGEELRKILAEAKGELKGELLLLYRELQSRLSEVIGLREAEEVTKNLRDCIFRASPAASRSTNRAPSL